ncbi:MAG: NADH-quinone oxidoreductase subunit C [Phycisphaeraceae bacterium]|nr:NADH-quinone oxidoreductase subunit C [Phycisphaeraceae bacterium]
MTGRQIAQKLHDRFGPWLIESLPDDLHPRVHIAAEHWRAVAEFLRQDPELDFDWLSCLTAVDYLAQGKLAGVYDLYSTTHGHEFAVKVIVDRQTAKIPSVMDLWPAADWHEREAFDLMGIVFDGHTDLRRILLPDDWEGYPLRKDYVFPASYQGIPGTYEKDGQVKTEPSPATK